MRAVARATTLAEINVNKLNQIISRHRWAEMPAGDGLFLAIGQLNVALTIYFGDFHRIACDAVSGIVIIAQQLAKPHKRD